MKRVLHASMSGFFLSVISACVTLEPALTAKDDGSNSNRPAYYRGLSLKEAAIQVTGETPSALLLGDTTTIDGEVWLGRGGLALALRWGRATLYEGGGADSFTAFALVDPIEDWARSLESDALPPPNAGATSLRILRNPGKWSTDLLETRTLISIEKSLGERCEGPLTGPCWIVREDVRYGSSVTNRPREATTYIDARTHEVMMSRTPLPDGYSELLWRRVR